MENTSSQTKAIKKHLENGNSITAFDALQRFGCLRLSGRIYDLRRNGVAVKSRTVKVNQKRVSEYYL